MQDPEFASVLGAAQAGAEWAWALLYRSHAGRVLGYLRGRGASDPENLLGEVFLNWRATSPPSQVPKTTSAPGCSRSPTTGCSTSGERHAGALRSPSPKSRRAPVPGDATAESALTSIGTDRVRELIGRLAPAQQEVLLLRIVGGLTVPEIADAIGKNTGAVKALQRRGLEALRRMMEHEGVPL